MESYNDTFSLTKNQGTAYVLLSFTGMHDVQELTARLTSEAFYNGEVESEVRLLIEEGKLSLEDCIMHQDTDRELIMEKIEFIRSHSIYPYHKCTQHYRERGNVYYTQCQCMPNRQHNYKFLCRMWTPLGY